MCVCVRWCVSNRCSGQGCRSALCETPAGVLVSVWYEHVSDMRVCVCVCVGVSVIVAQGRVAGALCVKHLHAFKCSVRCIHVSDMHVCVCVGVSVIVAQRGVAGALCVKHLHAFKCSVRCIHVNDMRLCVYVFVCACLCDMWSVW